MRDQKSQLQVFSSSFGGFFPDILLRHSRAYNLPLPVQFRAYTALGDGPPRSRNCRSPPACLSAIPQPGGIPLAAISVGFISTSIARLTRAAFAPNIKR